MDTKVCIICCKENAEGRKGLEICRRLICHACEEKIVSSAVYDKNYAELIDRLKKLWEDIPVEA
ncbi:MAG: hypothetical protein FD169_1269 [Bacillota bacterium]|nr:MAG: hypothetical protein FD169_1269 [Bacillota bacterium]MBS3950965.1 inhibitor of sigma-G Gin [Peptococcaceae bacterium]